MIVPSSLEGPRLASAVIEWLIGSKTGDNLSKHLPEQTEWLALTMVQLERAALIEKIRD